MQRRDFLKTTTAGATLAGLAPAQASRAATAGSKFTPCINQATTMKADFRTAMDAYHKAGFRKVELWLESLEPFLAKESATVARRVMADHGIEAAGACCEEDLFFPGVPERDKKLEGFKRKLDLSAQLGAHRFVMYSAISRGVQATSGEASLAGLREVGNLGKRFDVIVGIEFIAGAKFLGSVETTAKLLRRAAHPNLGIQFDTFHYYAGVSKLEDLDNLRPGEISFVHIDDVPDIPRELLSDEKRVYVGEGVMPHKKILRALARLYQGPISVELFQYANQDLYIVAKRSFESVARLLARLGAAG